MFLGRVPSPDPKKKHGVRVGIGQKVSRPSSPNRTGPKEAVGIQK